SPAMATTHSTIATIRRVVAFFFASAVGFQVASESGGTGFLAPDFFAGVVAMSFLQDAAVREAYRQPAAGSTTDAVRAMRRDVTWPDASPHRADLLDFFPLEARHRAGAHPPDPAHRRPAHLQLGLRSHARDRMEARRRLPLAGEEEPVRGLARADHARTRRHPGRPRGCE